MPETLQSIFDLPDVSFVDNDTLRDMVERLIRNYEERYRALTGKKMNLASADPMRIVLYAVALELYQIEMYVDRAGKQNLLKYSYGEFLDNLAALRGVTRQMETAATTTIRFTLSEIKTYAVGIPAGTRVTNGDGVYFQTLEYGEVEAGNMIADILAECTVEGIQGNDLVPGQLNILVDPLPYIQSVENITTTSGGAMSESDDSLSERVFLAPSSYSVAGPGDAYVYWAKTFNSGIGSVKVKSPSPGCVDIYILMSNGSLPKEEILIDLKKYFDNSECRPLTDLVTVKMPTVVNFNIDLTYYINYSDRAKAETIQQEVKNAIKEYQLWQTSEIGRDINPDELIKCLKKVGVKRIELKAPKFTVIENTEVSQCNSQILSYGGLEDD